MTPIRIAQLQIYLTGIPLKKPFNISVSSLARQENVVVALATDDGVTGWGEAQPAPGFSPDTRATIAAAIRDYLGPAALGQDVRHLGVLSQRLDQVLPHNLYAKAAIMDAAFDALARAYGASLNSLLGGPLQDAVPCAWAVGLQDTAAMVEEATWAVGQGFHTIKLKVGKDPASDLEHIRAVRGAVGDGVKLRLDANQGYSLAAAIPTLREAARFAIECVEQPISAWHLAGLRRVQQETGLPVMVDETVEDIEQLFQVAVAGAGDVVNITPAKNGGVYRARQCVDLALVAGIEPSFSTNFASSLGVAAVGALALASRWLNYAGEFHLGPLVLAGDLVSDPIVPGLDGTLAARAILGDGLGIGRSPDPRLLRQYTDHQEVLRWE